MMFDAGSSRDDGGAPKRNNRRETWCPGGKAGWAAPAAAVEALESFDALGGGGEGSAGPSTRKRPLTSLGGGASVLGPAESLGGAIMEGSEEGEEGSVEEEGAGAESLATGNVGEGPTPQRRRRGGSSLGGASLGDRDTEALLGTGPDGVFEQLSRVAQGLERGADRSVCEAAAAAWREAQLQAQLMQRELDDVSRLAQAKDEELRWVGVVMGSVCHVVADDSAMYRAWISPCRGMQGHATKGGEWK